MTAIEFQDVTKTYGATRALDGVTFTIDRGECVARFDLWRRSGFGDDEQRARIVGRALAGTRDALIGHREVARRGRHRTGT